MWEKHWLIAFCMCRDWGSNQQSFGVWDNAPTNWSICQGDTGTILIQPPWHLGYALGKKFIYVWIERTSSEHGHSKASGSFSLGLLTEYSWKLTALLSTTHHGTVFAWGIPGALYSKATWRCIRHHHSAGWKPNFTTKHSPTMTLIKTNIQNCWGQ